MAEKKSNSNKSTQKKSNSGGGSSWSLRKISFYAMGANAFLYLLAMIFSLVGVDALASASRILLGVANGIMICIVAVLAWQYVAKKPVVWKVLYVIILLVVLIGSVLPLFFF